MVVVSRVFSRGGESTYTCVLVYLEEKKVKSWYKPSFVMPTTCRIPEAGEFLRVVGQPPACCNGHSGTLKTMVGDYNV